MKRQERRVQTFHTKRGDDNCKKISGATTITGQLDKSNVLIKWAINCTCDYLLENENITKETIEKAREESTKQKVEAGNIGTKVHNVADLTVKSLLGDRDAEVELVKELEEITDERALNGIKAFKQFLDKIGRENIIENNFNSCPITK